MANLTLAPAIFRTFFDDDGVLLDGGLLYTYAAGTSDKLATYTDVAGLVPHSNPIVLNSAGRVPGSLFLLPASYKFVLAPSGDTDPPTAPIATEDNVGATPPTNIDNDIDITAGEVLSTPEVIYGSDGSGALTAGRWYKASSANAYSSSTPTIAFAVADVASGAATTARMSGRLTGFLGLTVGAKYYIGSTAGTITTTPTGISRYVGWADSVSSLIVSPNPAVGADTPLIPSGRLSLTTAVPVTTADVTAATTVYYVPYKGNVISLYDGARWVERTFTQLSIAVPATTNTMYDVFVYDNAGVPTLELLVWTNVTTRATALVLQDGMLVKTGALTRLYVGSFATGAVGGQTEDSDANRLLYNHYHQKRRRLQKFEGTASWSYTLATFRQARATATNQVAAVFGVLEEPIHLVCQAFAENSGSAVHVAVAIGEDSTTTPAVGQLGMGAQVNNVGAGVPVVATLDKVPTSVGYHTYVWLESSEAASTTSWKSGNNTTYFAQSGLSGWMWG